MSEVDFKAINDDIFTHINNARTDPQAFIKHLNKRMELMDENNNFVSNGIKYRTKEGQEACGDLLNVLATLSSGPLQALERKEGLDRAARLLADANGESGDLGHIGPESQTLQERLNTEGKWIGKIGECVGVQATNGLDFVLNWLIDDGVESRGDMKALINSGFCHIGVASNYHKIHGIIAVVVLAKHFYPIDHVTGRYVDGEEAENATNASNNLISKMPEEIREIPDDAVGMKVSRYYIEKDGAGKTQYVLEYKLKTGMLREEVKEYEGDC